MRKHWCSVSSQHTPKEPNEQHKEKTRHSSEFIWHFVSVYVTCNACLRKYWLVGQMRRMMTWLSSTIVSIWRHLCCLWMFRLIFSSSCFSSFPLFAALIFFAVLVYFFLFPFLSFLQNQFLFSYILLLLLLFPSWSVLLLTSSIFEEHNGNSPRRFHRSNSVASSIAEQKHHQ